jgi:hypothetical protein
VSEKSVTGKRRFLRGATVGILETTPDGPKIAFEVELDELLDGPAVLEVLETALPELEPAAASGLSSTKSGSLFNRGDGSLMEGTTGGVGAFETENAIWGGGGSSRSRSESIMIAKVKQVTMILCSA